MLHILTYEQIDRKEWSKLVMESRTGTWFQSPEAYDFFASMPDLFKPFVVGVGTSALRAVCVGYVTVMSNLIMQFFSRRAIITGGPCLADDATAEEVTLLMSAARNKLSSIRPFAFSPIYIETRNFNDYSRWIGAFEKAGFRYQPHLNFHVDTSSPEIVSLNLRKSRKRDIRTTIREGVSIVNVSNDDLREKKVREFYVVLEKLYKTKVKTPLFPLEFFLQLSKHQDGRLLLTEYQGRVIGGTMCVELKGKCLYEWFTCGEDGVYPHIFPSCYATYAGIQYAAEHGLPRYDMMGAGKPDEAYGVRDFKKGFGGTLVEHGRFLKVCKPLLYRIGVMAVQMLKKGI